MVADTQRHRLGVNFLQLGINKPVCPFFNHQKDGFMTNDNGGAAPNFYDGKCFIIGM
jgi:catalase